MAKGNNIVVSANPRGCFLEGVLTAVAASPGIVMEFTTAAMIGGRPTWQCFQRGTDGQNALLAILREDNEQGIPATSAYAASAHCFLYVPQCGEEINILVADVAGTGDIHTIGDYMIYTSGSGKFKTTTGSPNVEPFRLLETTAALTADTLIWAMCVQNG